MAEIYKRISTIQYFENITDRPALEYVAYISISDFKPKSLIHEKAQVIVCTDGSGTLHANDIKSKLSKNDVCLLNPYVMHGLETTAKERLECYVFGFLNMHLDISKYKVFPNLGENTIFSVLAPLIFKEAVKPTEYTQRALNDLVDLTLIELEKAINFSYKYNKKSDSALLADKIATYLDTHFNQQITIDELANMFFCSKSTVMHIFKKSYGISIVDYLMQCRLQEVKTWLKMSNMSISSIALNAGFSSLPFFYKYFQQNVGMTPVEYRKNNT